MCQLAFATVCSAESHRYCQCQTTKLHMKESDIFTKRNRKADGILVFFPFSQIKQVHVLVGEDIMHTTVKRNSMKPLWVWLACHFLVMRLILIFTWLLVARIFFRSSSHVFWLGIFLTVLYPMGQ
uniref:Ubiquitin-conjugating enzyme E2 5-like isoform X2 n=1 Tax=Rhizophora mucronata TaxID=61149 RepID=A0A2P2L3X1_RHIMU